jgi:hypothetical protein
MDGREVSVHGVHTQQVHDDGYASAVFLHHRRLDRATEQWTFESRYVPPPRVPNLTYYGAGYALFSAFLTTFNPSRPTFNEAVYEQCIADDLATLCDKGLKTLTNISYRNDPSLTIEKAETFLKSQDITKLGTEFRDAKKGQMVTGFCALVNIRFGPLARIMYAMLRMSLPPEILILSGITLDSMQAWFNAFWDWSAGCFSDDFEGFDGGQNEEFLGFQAYVAHYFGVPPKLFGSYVYFVTHIEVLGKRSRPWIPSGIKPTYLFNCLDNMAFQSLKYKMTPHPPWNGSPAGRVPGVARAYSGDDSSHNELLRERASFQGLPHKFRLKSTGGPEPYPHFCGTVNLPSGSFADPKLLLLRVVYKLNRGKLFTSCLGYAEQCMRLQRCYTSSEPYLSSAELNCHAKSYRILRAALLLYGIPLIGSFFLRRVAHYFNLTEIDDA